MCGFRVIADIPGIGLTCIETMAESEADALAAGRMVFDLPDSELFVESLDS